MRIITTQQLPKQESNLQKIQSVTGGALVQPRSQVSLNSALAQQKPSCACGGDCPRCQEEEGVVQRQVFSSSGTNISEPHSVSEQYHKPELEFNSVLHFNSTFSGFNPTSPPKENEQSVIWWKVWNTGWETAPEHMNRLTIYNANLCSGCRYEKDEIFRSEILAPAIVSVTQQGKSDYENSVLLPGLRAGNYDAYVDLDVRNQVEEINEDNNTNFLTFSISPSNEIESAD